MSRQRIIEAFKQNFCKVFGDYCARSSSLDWAEFDMSRHAQNAAKDVPNFIAAVYKSLEQLEHSGAAVPTVQHINQIHLPNNLKASKALKQVRQFHPALQASGHRADEVNRVLNSFAASIDAFFRYIQDSIQRGRYAPER